MNWQRVITGWWPRVATHRVDIGWPIDAKCLLAPDKLEERLVGTLREPVYDARGVSHAPLVGINGRTLRLLRRRTLQSNAGGTQVPEVSAIEITLLLAILKRRVIRRIRVTLRFPAPVARMRRVARRVADRSGIG